MNHVTFVIVAEDPEHELTQEKAEELLGTLENELSKRNFSIHDQSVEITEEY